MSLDDELKKYVEQAFSAPDASIYHYTRDASTILNCGYLKLFSHRDLNKKGNRELKRGVEIIQNKLPKIRPTLRIPIFNAYISRGIEVYTASFCEDGNSKYASGKYGKHCLEFKTPFLEQFKDPETFIILGRVKYNHMEQEKIITEILDLYEQYPRKSPRELEDLLLWLSICIPFFKEEKDHPDNECRIVTARIWSLDHPNVLETPECSKRIEFDRDDITYTLVS